MNANKNSHLVYFSCIKNGTFERKFSRWVHVYVELKGDSTLKLMSMTLNSHSINFLDFEWVDIIKIPVSTEMYEVAFQITAKHKSDKFESDDDVPPNEGYRFIMSVRDFTNIFKKIKTKNTHIREDKELAVLLNDMESVSSGLNKPAAKAQGGNVRQHRHLAAEMDKLLKQSIRDKRKSFRWLPVYFSSDMVHGSWWYTISSIISTLLCMFVLLNAYDVIYIGTDDSVLPPASFRLAWILSLISSVLFTVGSLVFIRACNDPPLPPLCNCSCFASDELFGAWFFFLGIFPVLPFCFIYFIVEQKIYYLAAMFVCAGLIIAGCAFIFYSYRHAKHHENKDGQGKLFITFMNNNCCKSKWVEVHCATDWLFGTWIVYYGTVVGNLLFIAYFLYELRNGKVSHLALFVYLISIATGLMFIIGAAYFVAGNSHLMLLQCHLPADIMSIGSYPRGKDLRGSFASLTASTSQVRLDEPGAEEPPAMPV